MHEHHLNRTPGDRQERFRHCALRRRRGRREVAAVHVVRLAGNALPALVDDGDLPLQSLRVDELVAFAAGLCLPMPPMAGAMHSISQPVAHPRPLLLIGVADNDAESLVRIRNVAAENAHRVHDVQFALGMSLRRRNVHVGDHHLPPADAKPQDLRPVEAARLPYSNSNDTALHDFDAVLAACDARIHRKNAGPTLDDQGSR